MSTVVTRVPSSTKRLIPRCSSTLFIILETHGACLVPAVKEVEVCVGNDVLHIDNVYGTTTKGTPQDTDGKWWEHFEVALQLYVKCVEILREIAPVDVLHSMSNHDYQSGFHLAPARS